MRITEDRLMALGFKRIQHDETPYESFEKHGINIWDYNGRYWIVSALEQSGIDAEFRTIGELTRFFQACGRVIEDAE